MTGILDRIKNTTVADLDKVTGDFSDVAPAVYRPRVEREMVRIVKGATDLQRPNIPNVNAGMVRTDGSGTIDTRPFRGQPTDRQRNYISNLIEELAGLDRVTWEQAVEYTARMTENNAWDASRGGNVSRWIDRLKAKVAELKARPAPVVTTTSDEDRFPEVPDGRYAVQDSGEGDWIFVRVNTGRKGTAYEGRRFVKIQASDDLHPIRNAARRRAILEAIRTMGWKESLAAYGQHLGACGRCGRTLTDAESRSAGIGPECRKKM